MRAIRSASGSGEEDAEDREGSGRRRVAAALRAGAALALLAAFAPPLRADATAVASFGLVGLLEDESQAAVLDLEWRFAPRRFGIGPAIGAYAASDGSVYLRAGLTRDFPFGERWNANVTLAGGAYLPGGGKRLGRGFEFRSALDLSYEARPGIRFGAALAHLSNAGIGESNPGLETLTLTMAFIPGRMTPRR